MSEKALGLRENPFAAGHDIRFVYPSRERAETIALFCRSIGDGEPFVLVTGDTGTGKTSVVSEALGAKELKATVAFLAHPSLTRAELLEAICLQFGIALPNPPSKPQTLALLEHHLRELRSQGRAPVLVMDEAHGLDTELLEEIRLLSNLEAEGRELLQIVLVGLPDLDRRLGRPELAQLRQRIAVRCQILPLDAEDTERYVHHRVSVAGGQGPALFPHETCREIRQYTYGFPREINTLAGRALDRAWREGARTVTPEHVRGAVFDARLGGGSAALPAAGGAPSNPTGLRPKPFPPGRPAEPAGGADPGTQTEPSKGTDPVDAREWVSRFVDPERPIRIGAYAGVLRETEGTTPEPSDPRATGGAPTPAGDPDVSVSWALREPARPETGRPHGSPGRAAGAAWFTLGAVAVAVLGTVILVTRAWDPAPGPSEVRGIAATGRETKETPSTASSGVAAQLPGPGAGSGAREARRSGSPRSAAGAGEEAAVDEGRELAAERYKGESRGPRYGLEVASYINPDRAAAERERLSASAGLPCRIVNDSGDDTYRLVLGAFESRRAAYRAADALLSRGLVDQARVVTLAEAGSDP